MLTVVFYARKLMQSVKWDTVRNRSYTKTIIHLTLGCEQSTQFEQLKHLTIDKQLANLKKLRKFEFISALKFSDC